MVAAVIGLAVLVAVIVLVGVFSWKAASHGKREIQARFEQFEATIKSWPQVLECILITGQSADFQLKVLVKDMEEYQDFLLNKLTRLNGVSDVRSSFVLRQVVSTSVLPLDTL